MSASAGSDAIVYEQAGYIHLVDTATRKAQRLPIEVTGRFSVGASAAQESRAHDSQRRALADRRARGVRGAGRYLHAARREGTGAQPDGECRRARSQPGMVARWFADRVAVGRERRVSVDDRRADRRHQAASDPAALESLLLRAGRGRPTASCCCSRTTISTCGHSTSRIGTATKLDTDTYDDPGRGSTQSGRRIRDGWRTRRASAATCGRSFCIRSLSAKPTSSPTDSRTPSHRPSMRAASISTSWRARTTHCGPAGSR